MKITAEGILGNARSMNLKREQGSSNSKSDKTVSDTVTISTKVDNRISAIYDELKKAQNELTGNQIIFEGLTAILTGEDREDAVSQFTYNGKSVLGEYLQQFASVDVDTLANNVSTTIRDQLVNIRKLQVETENLLASNLVEDNSSEELIKKINRQLEIEPTNLVKVQGTLQPDVVQQLLS